jgi:hypothetical protein
MQLKSVSALFLILSGLALIAFETSFYGASPAIVGAKTKPRYPAKRFGTKHYGTIIREGSG